MNINLNFAMSFPPTKDLIINLLRVADGQERNVSDLNEYTAMPGGASSGKLRPHLDYANAMGLLNYTYAKDKYVVTRTPLGEKIVDEDFSINEELTLQLLNYNLSSNTIGTLVWNLIVRKQVIKGSASIPVLYKILETKYDKNQGSANKIITPFKSAQNAFFQPINFLNASDENFSIKSLKINKRHVYMYLYTLLFDWDLLFEGSLEITFEDIRDVLQWGLGFGWNESEMFQALQLCEDYGLIKMNKQLAPMTIVRNISKDDALDKLYDLL